MYITHVNIHQVNMEISDTQTGNNMQISLVNKLLISSVGFFTIGRIYQHVHLFACLFVRGVLARLFARAIVYFVQQKKSKHERICDLFDTGISQIELHCTTDCVK